MTELPTITNDATAFSSTITNIANHYPATVNASGLALIRPHGNRWQVHIIDDHDLQTTNWLDMINQIASHNAVIMISYVIIKQERNAHRLIFLQVAHRGDNTIHSVGGNITSDNNNISLDLHRYDADMWRNINKMVNQIGIEFPDVSQLATLMGPAMITDIKFSTN